MITPAFTKLQRSILTSSIWLTDDSTRLVWITLLALCDRDGIARCSLAGLAHMARVDPDKCGLAVETLMAADPDSRDLGDGRRIERVAGGFLLLSYERVLGEGAREERREYMRTKQAEGRAKKRAKGKTIRPKHRDDKGDIDREAIPPKEPYPKDIAPPPELHSGSYEQWQAEHGGEL